MDDILDKELDDTIRRLEQMGETQEKKSKIHIGNIHTAEVISNPSAQQVIKLQKKREKQPESITFQNSKSQKAELQNPKRFDWDTPEQMMVMPQEGTMSHPGVSIRRPGENDSLHRKQVGNLLGRFSLNLDGERVLNLLLFIVTLGMIGLIFTNYDILTVGIASFFLKIILTIGEIIFGILVLVIIWMFIRSRFRRRRRWW